MELRKVWETLASRYSQDRLLIDILWEEIAAAYGSKSRHYHNLAHLEYLFAQMQRHEAALNDADVVKFSIFYHDVVYKVRRQDNESKSADLARNRMLELGVPSEQVEKCTQQILATKDHLVGEDEDLNYFLDFDLAVLGAHREKYEWYRNGIRREYAIYPDFLYNRGRKQVLKHLLAQKQIYKSSYYHHHFEYQARQNMVNELSML